MMSTYIIWFGNVCDLCKWSTCKIEKKNISTLIIVNIVYRNKVSMAGFIMDRRIKKLFPRILLEHSVPGDRYGYINHPKIIVSPNMVTCIFGGHFLLEWVRQPYMSPGKEGSQRIRGMSHRNVLGGKLLLFSFPYGHIQYSCHHYK